jgi:hypothetical protein
MDHGGQSSLLAKVALTGNSAIAVYRSWGDPFSVAFVALAHSALLLLLHLLRRFEHARPEEIRGRVKAAVWALTTLLTASAAARRRPGLGDGGRHGRRGLLGVAVLLKHLALCWNFIVYAKSIKVSPS